MDVNTKTAHTKPAVDFSRSAISRYIQLATLFRRRIESGEWRVGAQIPTVDELAAECGVARATIRQALDTLEQQNLIERFRAKGTFVRRRPQEELWCEVGTDWTGLLYSTQNARIEVLSEERDFQLDYVAYPIGNFAPAYRKIRRRHWRDERPFLVTNIHIDERLMDRIAPEDLISKTALRLVHDVANEQIADARQTLIVGTADLETAEALDMPINAPVALVYRRLVDHNGDMMIYAEGIYRGDVVRLDIKLR